MHMIMWNLSCAYIYFIWTEEPEHRWICRSSLMFSWWQSNSNLQMDRSSDKGIQGGKCFQAGCLVWQWSHFPLHSCKHTWHRESKCDSFRFDNS